MPNEVRRHWMPHARFLDDPNLDCLMVDATAGGGGHSEAMLAATPNNVRLLCVDRDPEALVACRARLADRFPGRVRFAHGTFSDLPRILEEHRDCNDDGDNDNEGGPVVLAGVLADLGCSTHQLESPSRGFSFRDDRAGPLDMRMDGTADLSAAQLLNTLNEMQLVWIFREYGEVGLKEANRVARAVVAARPLSWTEELTEIIEPEDARLRRLRYQRRAGKKLNQKKKKSAAAPATRFFQALRIAVNNEMGELEVLLERVPPLLSPGAPFVVISFHSLEDRRVKHAFREIGTRIKKNKKKEKGGRGCADEESVKFVTVTPRALKATDEEVHANAASRSARLRVLRAGMPGNT